MFEQPVTEKQCSRCFKCKPTMDFKFRSMTMTYYDTCRDCDAEVKAAKQQPKPEPPPKPQRKCKGCDTWKPMSLFPRDVTCSGGHAYKCSACRNEERRQARVARVPQDEATVAQEADICAAWMATRLPVFGGGFGAAVIGSAT